MKHYDIIILGGGASACVCAITCKGNKNILIIDKLSKLGKKLMATGNGRCNLSNLNLFPSKLYYNQNINDYLSRFDTNSTLNLFNNLGLLTYSDEEGRVYPFSNSAKSVIDVLNNAINKKSNISISLENCIEKIEKSEDFFKITTQKEEFSCNKLVIATGGNTFVNIDKNFNINLKPFIPSLVSLKTQSTRLLDGVKISNVKLLAICGNENYSETGEILFKESGLSGIVTFNTSTLFARKNNFNGQIKIDLMPTFSHNKLKNILKERKKLNIKIKNFFDGMFATQLGYQILNMIKIKDEEKDCSTLTEQELNLMVETIKNFSLSVKGHYDNNQVYSGGISLNDLTKNLESKDIKNLYFCGEVCDVDGICGGYNLQWAWTSGYIVGESL